MSKDDKTLDAKMEKLAHKMADLLMLDDPPNKDAVDTFKSLQTYFVATRKLHAKTPDQDDQDDFSSIIKRATTADGKRDGNTN